MPNKPPMLLHRFTWWNAEYLTLVSCINAYPTLLSSSTYSPRFLHNSLLLPRASKLFFSLRKMKAGALELGEGSKTSIPRGGVNRGISILDFILRLIIIVGTLGSAIAMGTTNETLPFFTQFTQFRAEYDDLPTFTFFVIANSIVSGYLVLSLPMSILHIVRSGARASRIVLIFFDTAMLALLTAAASAASAIVYLAHKGNAQANWFAICQQFKSFCERISGSLIGSFGGIILFILLVLLSAVALSRC